MLGCFLSHRFPDHSSGWREVTLGADFKADSDLNPD
jgi:hypothetical protein